MYTMNHKKSFNTPKKGGMIENATLLKIFLILPTIEGKIEWGETYM